MKTGNRRPPCFYSDLLFSVSDKKAVIDEQGSLFSSMNAVSDHFRAFVQSHFCASNPFQSEVTFCISEVIECLKFSYRLQDEQLFKAVERLSFDMLKNEHAFRGLVNKLTANYCELKRKVRPYYQNDMQVVFPLVEKLLQKQRLPNKLLQQQNIPSFQQIALPRSIALFFKQFKLWHNAYSGTNKAAWEEMAQVMDLLEREIHLCIGLHRYLLMPVFLDNFEIEVLQKLHRPEEEIHKQILTKDHFSF